MILAHILAVHTKDHKTQQEAQQVQTVAKAEEEVQAEVAEGKPDFRLMCKVHISKTHELKRKSKKTKTRQV